MPQMRADRHRLFPCGPRRRKRVIADGILRKGTIESLAERAESTEF